MRPDIVGARQREPLAAVLDQPGNELIALLRRGRSGAEQVRRALLALVELRIDVERLAACHDRIFDRVAHRGGDAAEHHVDLVALDQLADIADGDRFVGGGVLDKELERPAEQAAGGVDLLDDHLGDIGVGVAGIGDRSGQVGGDADLDRTFGGIGPVGPHHPAADAGCDRSAREGEIAEKATARKTHSIPEHMTKPLSPI